MGRRSIGREDAGDQLAAFAAQGIAAQAAADRAIQLFSGRPVCIGCGCTETNPCTAMQEGPGGTMRLAHCSWSAVDEETGYGLCTQCALTPMDQLLNKLLSGGKK